MSYKPPKIRRHGRKYQIQYRIQGYKEVFRESFESEHEAALRAQQIAVEKNFATLEPPYKCSKDCILEKGGMTTLSDYLQFYVQNYGVAHWGDSQMSSVQAEIRNYIANSVIGKMRMKDIKTIDIDRYYMSLLKTPQAAKRDFGKDKKVGSSVIAKIHRTLHAAFEQAVKWQIISQNVVHYATLPKFEKNRLECWTTEDAKRALTVCPSGNLKVILYLAIFSSMRIGEICGLQWKNVEWNAEQTQGIIHVRTALKRSEKNSVEIIEQARGRMTQYVFPADSESKSVLVLKSPKTQNSIRDIYITGTVVKALVAQKESQQAERLQFDGLYENNDLVVAMNTGRPVENRLVQDIFHKFCEEHGFPRVRVHSLRHLSATIKLQLSGGDIKSVQADLGHGSAKMVTDVYAEMQTAPRQRLAESMESALFHPAGNAGFVSVPQSSAEDNPLSKLNMADIEKLATLLKAIS